MPEEVEEQEELETEEEESEENEEEQEEWTPPTKEEVQKLQNALKKANANNKRWREKALSKKSEETSDDDAEDKIAAKAAELAKPRIIKSEAKSALIEAGGTNLKGLIRLLDTDQLEVDDDGDVEGLEDEIDRLKEDYPEMFKSEEEAPKPRKRFPKADAGARGGKPDSTKSATEIQVERLKRVKG
jgi:hypothetical protein